MCMIIIRSWCPDLFSWNLRQFSSYFSCYLNQFHGISTNFSSFSINFQCIPTNFLGRNLNGFTCHLNQFQEMSTNLMSSETTSIGISSSTDGISTSSKELWKLLHPVSELFRKPSQWLLDNNQSSGSCELLLAPYESRIVPLSRWVRSLDDDILTHQLNVKGPSLFNRTYRLFLNTVHCYNLLEDYCNYEIQIHKALCEFAVEKGYWW